ncbi:MAG: hypothetical protein KF758_18420 [Anaerolineales bacterium]|nr:hypothetical protein [Anaerolineales bacterium]MBX3038892.1 hypothetical protein [Anaerolineales bacterium]
MEEENNPPIIIECPHCHVQVIPMANNICPSCREDINNKQNVNSRQVVLMVHESEELPPYCYSCSAPTDRYVRISADEESGLETLIFGEKSPESTSNVIVYLPECELCSDSEIELIEVDYENQTMKIMVDIRFEEKVLQFRAS